MPKPACFVTASKAIRIANDNGRARADVHHVPPQVRVSARRNPLAEMVLFVEEGTLEFVIGGASGFVTAGGFVRIPVDVPYAYRNAGDETARLISHAVPPGSTEPQNGSPVEITAA